MGEGYVYGPQWKSTVDHESEAWRAYCEAVCWVRAYLRTKLLAGPDAAKMEYRAKLDGLKERTMDARKKLHQDFVLVGKMEGERLEAEVRQALAQQASLQTTPTCYETEF